MAEQIKQFRLVAGLLSSKVMKNSFLTFYEWVKGVDDAHGAEDFLVGATN